MVVCEKLSVGKLVVSTDFWVELFFRVFPLLLLRISLVACPQLVVGTDHRFPEMTSSSSAETKCHYLVHLGLRSGYDMAL